MLLRIPFRVDKLGLNELNPIEIPRWHLTFVFGRETSRKWRRIVQQYPTDIEAHIFLAALLQAEKHYEQAIALYRETLPQLSSAEAGRDAPATDEFPLAQLRYELGVALAALGKWQEARAEWEAVLTLDEESWATPTRRKLLSYPADGSIPPHHYKLVVVNNEDAIATEEFDSYDRAWPIYERWKLAVRRKSILGVGLADYFPDQSIGIWMEVSGNKQEKAKIRELISLHANGKSA